MRRRPSVSGPGIHPLAQLYATVPPSMRQMFRGKANELRGADPVALAVATARLTSPALRNEAVLAGSSGAKGSPRLGAASGAPSLAVASPPLVPITLKPDGAGRDGGGAAGAAKADEGRRAGAAAGRGLQDKPASALGMSIETPAMSTVARETPPSGDAAAAQQRAPSSEKHDSSAAPPPVDKATSPVAQQEVASPAPPAASSSAAPAVEPAPATAADEQPSPAKSVGSAVASTLSAVARATVDAVGAAAKALLPIDNTPSASSAAEPAPAPPSKVVAIPAAGPGVEAVAPSVPVPPPAAVAAAPTIATTKKPRSKQQASACPSCRSAACPGRRLSTLCAQRRTSTSAASSVVPAKRRAASSADDAGRRPRKLRDLRRELLAVSEPLMPFSKPVRRVRVLPPTRPS